MNSKQRRKLSRRFQYRITLYVREERYYQFDQRVDKAKQFCRKKCNGDWSYESDWDKGTFHFQKESDATYFGLMWL